MYIWDVPPQIDLAVTLIIFNFFSTLQVVGRPEKIPLTKFLIKKKILTSISPNIT